jgi:hypothetical protein
MSEVEKIAAGHEMTMKSNGMIDQAVCSCGWVSGAYFDGREYAKADWEAHLQEQANVR